MKCYVWNCSQKAVIFIELTTPPYKKMPCCQRHADEFPKEYPRVKLDEHGKSLKEAEPKKIDVVKEMDRIEHEEFMDEYYPREEAK